MLKGKFRTSLVGVLLILCGLFVEASGSVLEPQTDWYGRGIIRQQTIRVMTARQKRRQYAVRKGRRHKNGAHRQAHS